MNTATATLPDPIAELWREARRSMARALRTFRGPAEIAKRITRRALNAVRRRLTLLEKLLMKLLLIEAASSPVYAGGRDLPRKRQEPEGDVRTRPSVSRCALDSSPQSGERNAEDSADPATWRVRFHLRIPHVRKRARRPIPRTTATPASAPAKARRLARRFEALRRVFANPRPAIARLARKLAALGAAAYAAARRIALARAPRQREGAVFTNAIVHAHDQCVAFRHDTS